MGRSTWRRSPERRPAQGRAKKPQLASPCRTGAPERERDEEGRKRYEQTEACFRVTRLRNRGHRHLATARFPIICGKTQVSKLTGRPRLVAAAVLRTEYFRSRRVSYPGNDRDTKLHRS